MMNFSSDLVPVPDGIRTRRVLPRVFAGVLIGISSFILLRFVPELQHEDREILTVFDPVMVVGISEYQIWENGRPIGSYKGELTRDEIFKLHGELRFRANEGGDRAIVDAEFSDFRHLQLLKVAVTEGRRALSLELVGGKGRVILTDDGGKELFQLAVPTPILLRLIEEGRYTLVSPRELQTRLTGEKIQFRKSAEPFDGKLEASGSFIDRVRERLQPFMSAVEEGSEQEAAICH